MKNYMDYSEDYFEKQERIKGGDAPPRVRPDRAAQGAAREAEKRQKWNDAR